jgi:hypothetical protein
MMSFKNSMLSTVLVWISYDDQQLEQWDQSSIAIGEPPFFIEVIEIDPLIVIGNNLPMTEDTLG